MRWTFGLVALLLAAAAALMLSAQSAKRNFDAARRTLPTLREDVTARPFDASAARRTGERLRALLDSDAPPVGELREIAARAASWAAGAQPGTTDYHAAVALRGAADELFASRNPADGHRERARRLLDSAAQALSGSGVVPGGPAGGVRDQLENLQRSQQEKLQEIEREAP